MSGVDSLLALDRAAAPASCATASSCCCSPRNRVHVGGECRKAAMTAELTPGAAFGPSSWVEVSQTRIDAFAEATGDHQWIHVDRERAAAGPFGTTIGHGYLTLSLLPAMSYEVVPRQEGGMGINYGLNRVRFPRPCRPARASAERSASTRSTTSTAASRPR